jgi:hypothetical protein
VILERTARIEIRADNGRFFFELLVLRRVEASSCYGISSWSFFLKYPLRQTRAATPTSPVIATAVVMFRLLDASHEGLTSKLARADPSPEPVRCTLIVTAYVPIVAVEGIV